MAEDYRVVKADFDGIAALSETPWNHNNAYFPYLMRLVPGAARNALDIGCGKGELSAMLAERRIHVTAVDLSEGMIERAREIHPSENIDYVCANVLEMDVPDESIDLIITTATAHHLPYDWLLCFAKKKLRRGGRLLILDLYKEQGIYEHILSAAAVVPNIVMNYIKNGRMREDEHAKSLWAQHGAHDTYMTLREIHEAAKTLNGYRLRRLLFWRYLLCWDKP